MIEKVKPNARETIRAGRVCRPSVLSCAGREPGGSQSDRTRKLVQPRMRRQIDPISQSDSLRRRVLSLPTLLSFAVAAAFILFLATGSGPGLGRDVGKHQVDGPAVVRRGGGPLLHQLRRSEELGGESSPSTRQHGETAPGKMTETSESHRHLGCRSSFLLAGSSTR